MADCSPGVSQQTAEVNALNSKLGLDEQYDNRREVLARSRAWEDLALRKAHNASSLDHFINMTTAGATATAQQTGQTEDQQTVSPVRTGTGDAIVGGVGVSAEQVAANIANIATTLTPVIATAITDAITALLPVLVTAAGGASTPSQTQPKPTTAS
jgi:hypothetical protein